MSLTMYHLPHTAAVAIHSIALLRVEIDHNICKIRDYQAVTLSSLVQPSSMSKLHLKALVV